MPTLGLIGGSGLDEWGAPGSTVHALSPWGAPSGPISEYEVAGHRLYFLPRHGGDHALAPHKINYRANIHVLRALNVDAVVAINTVGALNRGYPPGGLSVPDQLIDYTWGRAHSFEDHSGPGVRHVEFAEPFSARWRERLLQAAAAVPVSVRDGACIGVTQGPRLETAAEIRRLARDGCDLVGMTSMPEAGLAREAGLEYACLALSANWAAGLEDQPISMAAIESTVSAAMNEVRQVVRTLLEQWS